MSYASATIGSVLDDVNTSHFLPAIQRPYVWTSDQVVTLFDSLMKGYGTHDVAPLRHQPCIITARRMISGLVLE